MFRRLACLFVVLAVVAGFLAPAGPVVAFGANPFNANFTPSWDVYGNLSSGMYWSDGGNDAFDGCGYPKILIGSSSAWVPINTSYNAAESSWDVTLSGTTLRIRHQRLGNAYVWLVTKISGSANQARFTLSGNMGSDSSTYYGIGTVTSGAVWYKWAWNDDGSSTSWDPRVWWAVIPSVQSEYNVPSFSWSGDSISHSSGNLTLPFAVVMAWGYTSDSAFTSWVSSEMPKIFPPRVPGKPSLDAGSASQWNVRVIWSANGNPSGTAYELWRETLSPDGAVVDDRCIYSGTALEFVTTDQVQGKYYTYRVRAKSGSDYSDFSAKTVYWTAPSGSASPGESCIDLSWSKVMNGLTYRVHYRVSGGSWVEWGTTSNLSATISDLSCANTYDVALSPVLPEGGPAWWSSLGTGIRPIPYVAKPTLGSAAATWQVAVSWSTGSNPSGTTYELWRKTLNPDGSVVKDEKIYSGTAAGFTTTDQASGKYYLYRVRASYAGVTSGFSAETSYWTAPGFSSVTPVGGGISLSWPKVKDGLTYRVMWLPEGGSWQSATTTSLSYTISGLNPLVRYTVGLSAVLSEGGTEWRAGDTQVVPLAFAPGSGSLSSAPSSVTASWTANGNPSGVSYYAELRSQGGSVLASSGWTTSLSYTFSGLVPETPYRVYVKAKNAAGVETSWTYLGEISTEPLAVPGKPSLGGGSPSTWNVRVSWTAGSGNPSGVQYELWRKTLNPDGSVAEDCTVSRFFDLTGPVCLTLD